EDDILHRLQNYKKFVVVRHPFERVISAFKNKFEKNYTSSQYFKKRFGVLILKRFRNGDSFNVNGDGVKFSEFVRYMIDTYNDDPSKLNEHWAPVDQLCHPCDVRYNIIGKYENLEEDAQHILESINAPKDVHFPPIKPSQTTKLVDAYIDTLSNDQLEGFDEYTRKRL
ncbi:Carbohydrate sulfotransferase 14, partial [Armadillidium nasatum]